MGEVADATATAKIIEKQVTQMTMTRLLNNGILNKTKQLNLWFLRYCRSQS